MGIAKVVRDAITGKFAPASAHKERPETTVQETVRYRTSGHWVAHVGEQGAILRRVADGISWELAIDAGGLAAIQSAIEAKGLTITYSDPVRIEQTIWSGDLAR